MKAEAKKAQAEAIRKEAENAARFQAKRGQTLRSAAFAAARAGDAERVKKGVWEDEVDANGGEVKLGAEEFINCQPKDPRETLLHIAAKQGNVDLLRWLDAHS